MRSEADNTTPRRAYYRPTLLAATGEPVTELAAAFGIGRATAYRYLAASE